MAKLDTCKPANGAQHEPSATLTCAATQTVNEADIDAGICRVPACVDDGPNGAAQVCDDEDTPGSQNPALSIVKDDNGATFSKVGDVITYSITARKSVV